jgi:hypothetical protein
MEFGMALIGGVPGPQAQLASYGTQLPSNPTDGQEHVLVDSTTNPSYQWKFRYNAGSTSAYKWEFVGGAPAINTVDTQEMTTSQTFVNLATVGPQLAIPRDGEYEISWGAGIQALSSGVAYMGIRFGAAATNNNDVVYMYQGTSTAIETNAARTRKYTLVAGSGVPPGGGIGTAYRNNNNTTQCYFAYRWLRVQPVRIS